MSALHRLKFHAHTAICYETFQVSILTVRIEHTTFQLHRGCWIPSSTYKALVGKDIIVILLCIFTACGCTTWWGAFLIEVFVTNNMGSILVWYFRTCIGWFSLTDSFVESKPRSACLALFLVLWLLLVLLCTYIAAIVVVPTMSMTVIDIRNRVAKNFPH